MTPASVGRGNITPVVHVGSRDWDWKGEEDTYISPSGEGGGAFLGHPEIVLEVEAVLDLD